MDNHNEMIAAVRGAPTRSLRFNLKRVREAIASDMLDFIHMRSEDNPADILSKHWGYQQIWLTLQQVLFPAWSCTDSTPIETEGSDKQNVNPSLVTGTDAGQTADVAHKDGSSG